MALLTASTILARQSQDATRGLTVVPAPVGPNGALQELYTGSYALLVGVSRYDSPAAWAPLESIPQELDSLATTLRQLGFQQVEVIGNPTGSELKQAVEGFMRKYGFKADTRLLFFFAGHGYTLDDGTRGYFVPRDAPDPVADQAGFRATALAMQQVSTWAGELVARHALFAFDSCFSGTIFRTRNRVQPARITALTQKPVRQFLSAGGAGETVPAKSVFTPVFVRGLSGAADLDGDGYLTGTELFNYVQSEVIAYRTGQTPQFGTVRDPRYDEGDLVFLVPKSPIASAPNAASRPAAPPNPSSPTTPPQTTAASAAPGAPPTDKRVPEGSSVPSKSRSGDAAFTGEYNMGGAIVKIQSSPAGLQWIQAGNPVHTLVSAGGRKYTSATIPGASLEFRLDDANEVDALYLSMPQVVVHGVRIEGPAPDAATLADLAGTYDLTPVIAATVSVRAGALIYRVTNDPKDYVLLPARGLHFAFDGLAPVSLRFHRSANGPASHFVLYGGDTTIVGMRRK